MCVHHYPLGSNALAVKFPRRVPQKGWGTHKKNGSQVLPFEFSALLCPKGRFAGEHSEGIQYQLWPTMAAYAGNFAVAGYVPAATRWSASFLGTAPTIDSLNGVATHS